MISASQYGVITLSDLADVSLDYEDELWVATHNKKRCGLISMKLTPGYNILHVNKELMAVVSQFKSELPPNVQLSVAFEQASGVSKRINTFFINLLQGVLLVGTIILLFLGWRSAVLIVTVIPICIVLALAVLNSAGYGLQQISIASLVLALGLLVDNGIVVIENIKRHISNGSDRLTASIEATSEVGMAIVSSTVTTLLSFFPLTQLGEGAGLFLISLPLTVIFTLVISLILALGFSPLMSRWILPAYTEKKSYAEQLFEFMGDKIYRPILDFSLRYGWFIVAVAVVLLIWSVSLFPKIGVSFFPTADKPILLVDIETPKGSSIQFTAKAVKYVEFLLDDIDYVKDYTSNVGNGHPQIYYNRFGGNFEKEKGQILANLDQWEAETFYNTIARLRKEFRAYPGARITVEELKNGAPVAAPIEIRVKGEDLDRVKFMADRVEEILASTDDVINITNPLSRPKTYVQFLLDKERAGLLGVSHLDFDQTVRASFNGFIIDQVTLDDDEEYNVVVRMPFDESPSIEDYKKIYLTSRSGVQLPLTHVSDISLEVGAGAFSHINQKRYVAVTASVTNLDNTIAKTLEVVERIDSLQWNKDVSYEVGGEYEEQQSTFGSLGIILFLSAIAIFAVLVLQFRSVLQPLIVFAAIPLAVCGSFIALYLSGWPFFLFCLCRD